VLLEYTTGYAQAWTMDVPKEVLNELPCQETYIAYGEAFAPLLAFMQHTNKLCDSSVVAFIDNMGVLCSLVVGHSKVVDLSVPIYPTVLLLAQMRAKVWWEYVDSNANIADGPSRDGVLDPVCRNLKIPVHKCDWPKRDAKYKLLADITQEIIGRIK